MLHVGVGPGILLYVHCQLTYAGVPYGTGEGVAVNVARLGATGGVAIIVTCFMDEPAEFVHVNVYVVVAAKLTLEEKPFKIDPTPLSIVQVGLGVGEFANVQAHLTFVGVLMVTDCGVVVNVSSIGAIAPDTADIVIRRMAEPALFVHVKV